ncbi:MAG: ParB/RepB/Spo0J family partition protein [Candidatus Marinimicrobia bacterium]|nr:ParB/RepB/Spo0J family partition protein [Candidatus Neomarinimicrobiota bacterium]MBL7022532.1 ParB/RepB/Spo0J family partition protein [Candidatus Neomarinimicrobiota bacterium]MBL7108888.1 ParB/RepB/Spo0J family partition protein [Candidatus Neomarinimicrobiota bacterium]
MTDKRLGKGLRALIPSYSTEENDRYMDGSVPVENIIPNRNQPRQSFSDDGMEDLVNSIKENGILQPLTVRDLGENKYELIAGERRFRAAKTVGLKTVPTYIISVDTDVEMLEYALVENVQREDLNPIEESEGYAILSGKYNMTQEEISQKVGKSRPAIANSMRLLKLPPEIKRGVKTGEISAGHARAILSLRKSMQMLNLFQRVVNDGLSVRQTEELANRFSEISNVKPKNKSKTPKSPTLLQYESELISAFGTKVTINRKKTGRGKINIEFYSDEDLDRILDVISNIEKVE